MTDDVRWFDELGKCRECANPATGKLMGSRNDSYGPYCKRCAGRRLKKAQAEREKEKGVTGEDQGPYYLPPIDLDSSAGRGAIAAPTVQDK